MVWEIAIGHIGGENLSLCLFGMDMCGLVIFRRSKFTKVKINFVNTCILERKKSDVVCIYLN